jgi:hypothetical protein
MEKRILSKKQRKNQSNNIMIGVMKIKIKLRNIEENTTNRIKKE